jgi:hypothetical protein
VGDAGGDWYQVEGLRFRLLLNGEAIGPFFPGEQVLPWSQNRLDCEELPGRSETVGFMAILNVLVVCSYFGGTSGCLRLCERCT